MSEIRTGRSKGVRTLFSAGRSKGVRTLFSGAKQRGQDSFLSEEYFDDKNFDDKNFGLLVWGYDVSINQQHLRMRPGSSAEDTVMLGQGYLD